MPANSGQVQTVDKTAQRKRTLRLRSLAIHAILLCGSFVFLFTLIWMISTSLKPIEQTMVMPPQWIPKPLEFKNYLDAVRYIPFLHTPPIP